ncbi:hypothetical protein FVE85_8555 [Porphyridium purpureum]|uniref:Uncharacterized protein n=1 Tax=Porphyridium purpureum TaxID=35688 RepID=A0A5J4YQ54_PORPP|nr:hypothetical protein FVE85_8555 [Porphyridium purpureum]|eukprot:POR0699..scf296_7
MTAEMAAFMEKGYAKLALQAMYRKREELAEKGQKVFGLVLGLLCADSKAALRAMPGYAELDIERRDAKGLLNLVVETHLTRGSHSKLVNLQYSMEQYEELRALTDESVIKFRARFDAALTTMRVVGETTGD